MLPKNRGRLTTACSRPPTAQIIKRTLPAEKLLIERYRAGPAAADAEALGETRRVSPSGAADWRPLASLRLADARLRLASG
jgi:hypothetical protein